MGFLPAEGHWCDVTDFMLRRVRCGDAVEATPPKPLKGGKKKE
jgi:hypothetical protein